MLVLCQVSDTAQAMPEARLIHKPKILSNITRREAFMERTLLLARHWDKVEAESAKREAFLDEQFLKVSVWQKVVRFLKKLI